AADHATSAAKETLDSLLENDFDVVPCPVCGHYQKYMFSKLLETKGMMGLVIPVAVIMAGCIAAVIAVKCSIVYLQHPSDDGFRSMVTAWFTLLIISLIGLVLSILRKRKIRRFDPNSADQQERIALGQSRAVTRAEFERIQREKGGV